MDIKRLQNKTAIVTGGGSGIGRAIALRLAQEGARVGVLDMDASRGEQVSEEIRQAGGTGAFHACNVTQADSIRAALDDITATFGPLDIAVNNAGVACIGTVLETTEQDFDRVMSVNVKGVYLCLQQEVERMRGRGGVILNLGSVAAEIAVPDRFAYATSKSAVHMMTLAIARDHVGEGIRCNAIAPARVHTPFVDGYLAQHYPGREAEMFEALSKTQPIGRMATPEEVAALAAYLCSDEASFITGSILPLDGGFRNLKM